MGEILHLSWATIQGKEMLNPHRIVINQSDMIIPRVQLGFLTQGIIIHLNTV